MEKIFTDIYENEIWGTSTNLEYSGSSGPGSSNAFNRDVYVPCTKAFIENNYIKTVVDIGCGDFYIGPSIYDSLDISYTGYDVYKKVIDYLSKKYQKQKKYNFVHSDVTNDKENIKNADLCILKDVVQHWELADIYSFLDYIIKHKKFKYILLCNSLYTSDTTGKEIRTGDYKPRSCEHLPLSKYNPKKLYNYGDKEVSYISLENETNL